MFWLGLAATVSAPGLLGASIPFGWVMLSATLPLALWRKGEFTFLHSAGVAFLAYAMLSILWAPDRYDAVWALWQLTIIALTFWLGSTLTSIRSILAGLAVGLSISSAFAIVQWIGYPVVLTFPHTFPGLLFNPIVSGEAAALVIVGLASERMWWYILPLIPLFALSHSRGAYIAAWLGILALPRRWILPAGFLALALTVALLFPFPHDALRFRFWEAAVSNLTLFGNGAGSFLSMYCCNPPPRLVHPEYVHNDFLQLAFEYGLGSIPLLFILAWAAGQTQSREWPLLAAFLFLAAVSFPLYTTITVFIGALAAGRIARGWSRVRVSSGDRRHDFVLGMA